MADDSSHKRSRRRSFMQALGAIGAGAAINPVSSAAADLGSYYQSVQDTLTGEEGLPEGEFLYADNAGDTLAGFELNNTDNATVTTFETPDQPFPNAKRIEMGEGASEGQPYSHSLLQDVEGTEVEDGDVLLAVVSLRGSVPADVGAQPTTQAGFKYRYTNPDGSTGYSSNAITETAEVNPGADWQQYYFPIEATKPEDGSDFQPYLEFWTGYRTQTIEFGGLALLDYSNTDVSVDELPVTEFEYNYEGRAEDAAWREDAAERIDDLRKTDYEVNVVGPDGKPVADADVHVEMTEHEFPFGTAVEFPAIGEGDSRYEQVLVERFNKATPENGTKVPAWEGRYGGSFGPEVAQDAIGWLNDQGLPVRGHPLVWTEYEWMLPPESAGINADTWPDRDITRADINWSDSRIDETVRSQIRERANALEGMVTEWDMHNHPIFYPEIWQDLGFENVVEWWEVANEADPEADMVINEMDVLDGGSQRAAYDEHISRLLDNGVELDGIGFMAHFGLSNLTPPTEVKEMLDQFAEHGEYLQVTEFDVQINDRSRENEVSAQADYTRDFLTMCFSHPAMDTFISWGFWADRHWRPTGAYYNSDWSLRPNGEAYMDLVFDEWWTDQSGTTDSEGAFGGRAFKGDHEIVASNGEWYGRAQATFDDENGSAVVQIAPVDVGAVDVTATATELQPEGTAQVDASLYARDETELPIDTLTYESSDEDVVTVDEDGAVTAVGAGTATVTVTASGYRDTAAGSARFTVTDPNALGEPVVVDDASDLNTVSSSSNVSVATYSESEARHGDTAMFQKNDAGSPSTLTYNIDTITDFRMVSYINYNATSSDAFTDFTFEVSADGSSWSEAGATRTVNESPNDSNGYYARWTHTARDLSDASYLRITAPAIGDLGTYNVAIGAVELWGSDAEVAIDDPAADFSLATSNTNLTAATYSEANARHGDTAMFQKSSMGSPSTVTYNVADGVSGAEVVAYINYNALNSDSFTDFVFEASADGNSYQEVEFEKTVNETAGEANGYYDKWTYSLSRLPEGMNYFRIRIPGAASDLGTYNIAVGSVTVRTGGPTGGSGSGGSGEYGTLAVEDPAENFSQVASNDGMGITTYQSFFGEGTRLQNSDISTAASITYEVEDDISAFEVGSIVNTGGAGDFSDLVFEVSADGESFQEVNYTSKDTVTGGEAEGYFDQWTYMTTDGIPNGVNYLRVTIPAYPNGGGSYAINLTSVRIWTGTVGEDADTSGPVVVLDNLAPDTTYVGTPAPETAVFDDRSQVVSQSFSLDGEAWDGRPITDPGEHTFALRASSGDERTTETEFGFTAAHETELTIENRRGRPGRPAGFVVTLTDAETGERLAGHPVSLYADGEEVETDTTSVSGEMTVPKGQLFSQVSPRGGDVELRAVYHGEDSNGYLGSEVNETLSPGNGRGNGN